MNWIMSAMHRVADVSVNELNEMNYKLNEMNESNALRRWTIELTEINYKLNEKNCVLHRW